MSIYPLFTTPVLKKKFEFDVPQPVDSDVIFEEKGFEKLREIALNCSGEYFYGIMKVMPDTGLYITKSYVNRPNCNNRNSVITGIIMISDGIITFSKQESMLQFRYVNENECNSSKVSFNLKKGEVLVFPSHINYNITGDTITWYTFVYNCVNRDLFVPPPKVFGKPEVEWNVVS